MSAWVSWSNSTVPCCCLIFVVFDIVSFWNLDFEKCCKNIAIKKNNLLGYTWNYIRSKIRTGLLRDKAGNIEKYHTKKDSWIEVWGTLRWNRDRKCRPVHMLKENDRTAKKIWMKLCKRHWMYCNIGVPCTLLCSVCTSCTLWSLPLQIYHG